MKYDFNDCFLGQFEDGGNIDQIDYTIIKVSFEKQNSVFCIKKNQIEDFKKWYACQILSLRLNSDSNTRGTELYNKFIDGSINVNKLFNKVGLTIRENENVRWN